MIEFLTDKGIESCKIVMEAKAQFRNGTVSKDG